MFKDDKTVIKPIRIIHTDDDEDDRELFRDALLKIEIPTVLKSFSDCNRMVSCLESRTSDLYPDIIFLDINMPKKDGLSCLREIRERNKRFSQVPIIMFTISSRPIDIELSRKFGANLYLNKPNGIKDLVGVLTEVLSPAMMKSLNAGRELRANM